MATEAGADLIDLNMGCPVRKVCRAGAGAALLAALQKAVAIARAAAEASGLPVTVKLRPGHRPGERQGLELAHRLVQDAGVAGIGFHPRHASQGDAGRPDYALARELAESLPVPVVLSGGPSSEQRTLHAFAESGAAAVMLARGSLGNPWRFARLLWRPRLRSLAAGGSRRARVGDRTRRGATGPAVTCASPTPGTPTRFGSRGGGESSS
jgi:tRNA-dihydrouridine synthase B